MANYMQQMCRDLITLFNLPNKAGSSGNSEAKEKAMTNSFQHLAFVLTIKIESRPF